MLPLNTIRAPALPRDRRFRQTMLAAGLAGMLLASACAHAENYALIMTIGSYFNPSANLQGIDLDANNATKIAAAMGVPQSNIIAMKDDQVTMKGIRQAFDDLSSRINRGDNIFIYYSGHGAQDSAGGSKCTESLLTYDMDRYHDSDLQHNLELLSKKAGQVVMMNDSCFSGGQAESKAIRGMSGHKAKFWKFSAAGPGYSCGEAINMKLARNLVPVATKAGSNLLYIAASQDNEVANATSEGSAATLAWYSCLMPDTDTDHSGALSGSEMRVCAQRWLDQNTFNQHVTLVGNKDLPLAFVGGSTSYASNNGAIAGARALEDIRNGASPGIIVTLQVSNPRMRIQQDALDFSVTTSQAGYLTILQVGSDGHTFNRIFPNEVDQNNYITGTVRLPRPSWMIGSGGPAGTSYLMAIVSESPKDLAKVGKVFKAVGPFSSGQGTAAARTLFVAATGADTSDPGRYGTSAVVPVVEY